MYVLLIILLVVLPFGTAIACGALMQWAGNIDLRLVVDRRPGARDLFLSQMHGSSRGSLTPQRRNPE